MKGAGEKPVEHDSDYEERLKVAVKAHKGGQLIHSQTTGLIYTPREFLESKELVVYKMRGLETFSNLTFFYPKAAIDKKLENLQKARIELDNAEQDLRDFMTRLLKAFEILPKDK